MSMRNHKCAENDTSVEVNIWIGEDVGIYAADMDIADGEHSYDINYCPFCGLNLYEVST